MPLQRVTAFVVLVVAVVVVVVEVVFNLPNLVIVTGAVVVVVVLILVMVVVAVVLASTHLQNPGPRVPSISVSSLPPTLNRSLYLGFETSGSM